MDEIGRAQADLGRALRRARAGEDPALAGKVREEGERLARLLFGVIAMARLHALDNRAFDQPIRDVAACLARLYDLLGSVHLLTVEDQVYVNDVRIRLEGGETGGMLASRLHRHRVGGLTFHGVLSEAQWRRVVALLSEEPTARQPRPALASRFRAAGLDNIELVGMHRFRFAGEGEVTARRDAAIVAGEGMRLAAEAWENLAAQRLPNPLPLRRLVTEMMESEDAPAAVAAPRGHAVGYASHLVRVCKLCLLVGKALGLPAAALQDLGLAALYHDVGYAALPASAQQTDDGARELVRHPAAGARLLLRQRGFHEAKVRRVMAALEHHRRFDDPRGRPSLFARIVALAEDFDTAVQSRAGGMSPHETLARMAAASGTAYDPCLLQVFINVVGRFPPGTLLRLQDGRVGCVVSFASDREAFARPVARIEVDAEGRRTAEGVEVDLKQEGAPLIMGVVDPADLPPHEPPPLPQAAAAPPVAEERPADGDEAPPEGEPLFEGVLSTVLRDLFLGHRTGVLYLTRSDEQRSVRFWKGNVVHASSNRPEDHLGEVAVRDGLLRQEDLDRASQLAVAEHKRLGTALRELGIMNEEQTENALAAHAREVISKAFPWTEGAYRFEEMTPDASWFAELALRLSTPDLILEAVRRIEDPDVIRYHLGDINRVPRVSNLPALQSVAVSLTPLDGYVLSRVDGQISMREIIRIIPDDAVAVQRSLFGLLAVGIVEVGSGE